MQNPYKTQLELFFAQDLEIEKKKFIRRLQQIYPNDLYDLEAGTHSFRGAYLKEGCSGDDPDDYEIKNQTQTFDQELKFRINKIIKDATKSIDESIMNTHSLESGKHLLQLQFDTINYFLMNAKLKFQQYPFVLKSLEDFKKYLLERYPSLKPSVEMKTKVPAIPRFKKELDPKIFKELASFADEEDQEIFKRENHGSDEDTKRITSSLKFMCDGNFSQMALLEFECEKGPAYYIISKLKDFYKKLKLSKLEESQKVKIKDDYFDDGNCSRGKNAFIKNETKIELKKKIDELFDRYVKK